MPRLNQALAFVKPHAAGHKAALDRVAARFAEAGIQTVYTRDLSGDEVRASGAIDRHYAVNARAGTCDNPAALFISPAARARFQELFGESWDEALRQGRLVSGLSAQTRLGLTGEQLNSLWAAQKTEKIAGGLYVARFPALNAFLLNGFYPSIRDLFTAPAAVTRLMVVAFDAATLPWRAFRAEVIGATNPAAADPRSIRGSLYADRARTGLAVTYRENIIHASASPFEALIEKNLWIPEFPLERDPLWQALKPAGLTLDQMHAWRDENPQVRLDGAAGPLVETLEDRDTDWVADRLLTLIRLGARPGATGTRPQ